MKMNLCPVSLLSIQNMLLQILFGNIYSSNTNQFTQSTLEKFDEKLLQSKTHWYVENPLLIENVKLNRFSQSTPFNLSFPFRVY